VAGTFDAFATLCRGGGDDDDKEEDKGFDTGGLRVAAAPLGENAGLRSDIGASIASSL
jgi:hypothetical protein